MCSIWHDLHSSSTDANPEKFKSTAFEAFIAVRVPNKKPTMTNDLDIFPNAMKLFQNDLRGMKRSVELRNPANRREILVGLGTHYFVKTLSVLLPLLHLSRHLSPQQNMFTAVLSITHTCDQRGTSEPDRDVLEGGH